MEYVLKENNANSRFDRISEVLKQLKSEGQVALDEPSQATCTELLERVKPNNLFSAQMLLSGALKAAKSPSQDCECYYELANVTLALGPLSQALEYAKELICISEKHGIKDMEFKGHMIYGHAYRISGHFESGIQEYQKAQQITLECGLGLEHNTCAFIHQQLCVYNLGRNNEALSQLLPLLEKKDLSESVVGGLKQVLGSIYRSAANWSEAIKYLKDSILIAQKLGDKFKEAELDGELGNVYRSIGEYKEALKLQQVMYDHALSHGDIVQLAAAAGYIGFTYYTIGKQTDSSKYNDAIEYLVVRYKLAEKIEDAQGMRWCINNIGKVYHAIGNLSIAKQLFLKSAKVASELGDLLGEGTSYGNLGSVSRDAGQHDDAIEYHKRYRENALQRMDIGGAAIMENELALDYLQLGNLSDARRYAWLALYTSLEIRSRLDNDVSRIANHEKNQSISYSILQYVLVEQNCIEAALLISELGRARALSDLLHESTQYLHFVNMSDIMDKSGSLKMDVISDSIRKLQKFLQSLQSNLVLFSIIDHPMLMQKKLKWLYIWVLRGYGEVHFSKQFLGDVKYSDFIIDQNFLSALQRNLGIRSVMFSNSFTMRDIVLESEEVVVTEQNDILTQLYNMLIKPIHDTLFFASSLETCKPRFIFVPHGFLFYTPFAALRCPDGEYLIQKAIISISPSIDFLFIASQKSQNVTGIVNGSNCLVVGNPLMPNEVIFQLPGAECEAKAVASILGCEYYCGANATKETVIAHLPRSQIIHLATHAILRDSLKDHQDSCVYFNQDGDYQVKGAIILSRSNECCNGILTSREIQSMNLQAELAVLSCCKTACGAITDDGTLGLSRALLAAGVGCIVVTLWSIYDETTTTVMKHFYTEYKQSRDAPLALHQAMIEASKQSNPACWAAFYVIGVSPGIA